MIALLGNINIIILSLLLRFKDGTVQACPEHRSEYICLVFQCIMKREQCLIMYRNYNINFSVIVRLSRGVTIHMFFKN